MKNLKICVIIIVLTSNFCIAQKNKSAIDEFLNTVAYIQDTVGLNIKYGTAFFVFNDTYGFLVTAKHVAKNMTENASITIRSTNDTPVTILLKELWNQANKFSWTFNDSMDVAVVKINPSVETIRKAGLKFIHTNLIVDSLIAPIRERPVTVLGFPLQLGIHGKFSPISKVSFPSSGLMELGPIFKRDGIYYILDDPSVSGFSGAPVLELPGAFSFGSGQIIVNAKRCVGLMSGTIKDNTGGKFALVIPSKYIIDTINMIK